MRVNLFVLLFAYHVGYLDIHLSTEISELSALFCLKELKHLKHLSIAGNPLCQHYESQQELSDLIKMELPQLEMVLCEEE